MLTVYGNIYTALKNVAQWKIEAEHEVANLDLSGENPKDGVAGIKSVYDKYAKNLNDKSAYVYNRFFNLLLAGKIRKQFMPVDTKNVESPKIQFQDS